MHDSSLTFDEYQEQSGATALPISPTAADQARAFYNGFALGGEAGEIVGKLTKAMRDNGGRISDDLRLELLKESGDALWHLTQFIDALDSGIEYVATSNLMKLRSRQERGVLGGSGDNR